MNVTNCRSCGRLFNVIDGERLCPECQKKIDERFKDVKEYLHDHPDASVEELSKELKISVKQIIRWIREERLPTLRVRKSPANPVADRFVLDVFAKSVRREFQQI